MSARRRGFLLLAALAIAAAMPAFAQTVAPAAGPAAGGTQNAVSIPDLSGIWAHPYLTGFEPPLSGPGPVRNKSRLPNGVANFQRLVGDYANPILKPHAAEAVKKHGEISLAGEGYPTPSNQCWPGGVPYVFWDFLLQMIQQKDKITMIYRHGDEVRHVRMNEPHAAQVTPSWYGDSVGHYDGDTLVIDTVGIKTGRPFAMLDVYGTPYTEAMHVVERYRLVDYEAAIEAHERNLKQIMYLPFNDSGLVVDPNYKGKGMQLQFTVQDEGVFTVPWSATMTYRRGLGEWPEFVCAENIQFYPGKNAAVPQANKPDF